MYFDSPWLIFSAGLSAVLSVWLWRSFSWRWHAGLVLMAGGVAYGGFALLIHGTADYFSFGLGYRSPRAGSDIGISVGLIVSGSVIIILSPLVTRLLRWHNETRGKS